MKRAWKWVAALVGIPALCVVAFWIDATSRAEAAIRAEEERLAKDIAAFRARLPAPQDPAAPAEKGHASRKLASEPALEAKSADEVLARLGTLRRRFTEGGFQVDWIRTYAERGCLIRLRDLAKHARPEEKARIAAALDPLEAARPTFEDVLTGEHLLDRVEVLRVYRQKEDRLPIMARGPDWRELFSWRILIARTLRELDDQHREMLELAARQKLRPPTCGLQAQESGIRSKTQLRTHAGAVLSRHWELDREWKATRAALPAK